MKKIYLVRHGQSTTNAGGDACPNAEVQLTELGQHQAESVTEWLLKTLQDEIATINISKYIRTRQTAEPLLQKTGMTPIIIEGLEEFNYLSFAKIKDYPYVERLQMADEYWASAHREELHGEGAESFSNFYQRVASVITYFEQLPAGNHVVFTHGYWISMLIWQLLGLAGVNQIEVPIFRQFEKSIRAQNGEVFCLTIDNSDSGELHPPCITKVRSLPNQHSDLSA